MPDSHRKQSIESILNEEYSVRYGDDAWRQQVTAITAIADAVGTTYGPYGHDKLIVDNGGNVEVTGETVSILRRLLIEDPVVRMVKDVANSQVFTGGDGTTATVVLLGALIERADVLVEQGLHPTTIAEGYARATDIATERLVELSRTYDITDDDVCERVARTVMSGTNLAPASQSLPQLVVEAVKRVTDGYDVDLNALRVRSDRGPGIAESELLSGALLDAVPKYMATAKLDDARILFIDGAINPHTTQTEMSFSIESNDTLDAVRRAESDAVATVRDRLTDLGVDVVVADSASDRIRDSLADEQISLLTSLSGTDRRFFRRTFDFDSVSEPMAATEDNILTADVEFSEDENYTIVTTPDAGTATIRLYGGSDEQLEELENVFDKAIETVAHVATDGRVLPGGGASEAAMAAAIRGQTPSVKGREQLAVYAFAEALETLPRLLASNAGLSGMDSVLALKTEHSTGSDASGIDADSGEMCDMYNEGVLDTYVSKKQMLSNVQQAVRTIVRIDGLIRAPTDESPSETGSTV